MARFVPVTSVYLFRFYLLRFGLHLIVGTRTRTTSRDFHDHEICRRI